MTTKRVLNVTSTKKQDNMLSVSNTNSAGNSQTVAQGSLFVNATIGYAFSLFCPTARSLTSAGTTNLSVDVADRTATTCFIRGYRENLRIQTSSPLPWLWRRIVFTSKGSTFNTTSVGDTAQTQKFNPYSDTSIGMGRQWFNLNYNNMPSTVSAFNAVIFKGAVNQDWNDVITAKVDTARISVLSDKTSAIRTSNNNGHFSERKLWYPMNKNIVYDDDEAGAQETTSYYSTDAKPGMGDVYIADYVVPGIGGSTTDIVNFNCSATLYWHER